jgi:uncharacterized protein YprB with RNaseH-like and TPR domain
MDLRAKLGRLRSASASTFGHADALADAEPLRQSVAVVRPAEESDAPPRPAAASPGSLRSKAERIAQLRALIGEVAARDRERKPQRPVLAREPRVLPFCQVPTAHGVLHLVERWLEPDHHHGRAPLRDGLRTQPSTLATLARDASLIDLDLSRALFLDTETTGLAGGTGTVAFLVGLARFVDGVLCIEQLIVPELGQERPVLSRLAERIAAASCVITYNGKSFDWPLLRTRFVLCRMPVPALPAHIDLLHAARSVWKQRMPSVRLTDVEREILHFERQDDIPGAEIPARYFEFLRGGSAEHLAPVLEHNQNDVIALAALLGALITRFERVDEVKDPRDALAFGRIALRARDGERALACARAALAASGADESILSAHAECAALSPSVTAAALQHGPAHTARLATPASLAPAQRDTMRDALLLASDVQRQLGDTIRSAELLEAALLHTSSPPLRAATHFALAKLYEHDQGALAAALRHARHTELIEGSLAHGRRLGRLHRRLLRQPRSPGSQA